MSGQDPARQFALDRNGNLDYRAIAIFEILLNTGIRIGELAAVELDDIQISERKGRLIIRSGKGGKYQEVPLNWVPPFGLVVRQFASELTPIWKGEVAVGPGLKAAHDNFNAILCQSRLIEEAHKIKVQRSSPNFHTMSF